MTYRDFILTLESTEDWFHKRTYGIVDTKGKIIVGPQNGNHNLISSKAGFKNIKKALAKGCVRWELRDATVGLQMLDEPDSIQGAIDVIKKYPDATEYFVDFPAISKFFTKARTAINWLQTQKLSHAT